MTLRVRRSPIRPRGHPVPPGQPADSRPPDGSVAEVLDWVGNDVDRAVAAADAEIDRDKPRATLLAALNKVGGVDE